MQIDIDPRMVGMRYPMELNLVGDSAETLRALIPLLRHREDRSWRDKIEDDVRRWWEILDAEAHESAEPLNPQLLFHELSKRLPDQAILTSDSGSSTDWWARHMRLRSGMKTALSGTLATMCPAIPYALAAKFAYPDRPVIAAIGDGAFQMLGINAMIDIARYHDRWANQQLVVLVLHNDDLNQVTWEQRVMSGDPKLEVSQTLPDLPYARYAELIGLKGIRVDTPDAVGPAWDEALSAGQPVLIEAITDPEVPPLPPHIRFEQAKELAHALPGDAALPGSEAVTEGHRRRVREPLIVKRLRRKRPSAPSDGPARWLWNLRAGRIQKTLAVTAPRAACRSGSRCTSSTTRPVFGNKWMWSPIVTHPAGHASPVSPGCAPAGWQRPSCRRAACLHGQRPAGRVLPCSRRGPQTRRVGVATYNLPMGPPHRSPRARWPWSAAWRLLAAVCRAGALSVPCGPADADHLPKLRDGGDATDAVMAAAPAARSHAPDDRPVPGLRRLRRSRAPGTRSPRRWSPAGWRRACRFAFLHRSRSADLARVLRPAVAQDGEPRIPVIELRRREDCAAELDGYQYDDMPDDRETWRLVARRSRRVAPTPVGRSAFAAADLDTQVAIVG